MATNDNIICQFVIGKLCVYELCIVTCDAARVNVSLLCGTMHSVYVVCLSDTVLLFVTHIVANCITARERDLVTVI